MNLISNFVTEGRNKVSLSSKFPQLSIRNEKDFFMECDVYDVVIPVLSESSSNNQFSVLERCILRLLKIDNNLTDQQISEKLCLGICNNNNDKMIDISFVKFIRARLKDKGLIESSGNITEKGKEAMYISEAQQEEQNECIAQIIYIRQLNKPLSYIHIGELENETFDINDKKLTMKYGSVGNEKTIEGKIIYLVHNSKRNDFIEYKAPNKDEARRLIAKYNKLCGSYDKRIRYNNTRPLKISPVPKSAMVHMKAFLQNGNVMTPIISDGFSCNIDGLLNYMKSTEFGDKIIQKLFQDESVIKEPQSDNNEIINKKEYYEIYDALKKISIQSGNSIDSNLLADKSNAKIIQGYFSALEWTLHYYLIKKQNLSKTIRIMSGQSSYSNKKSSAEYAEKLGLESLESDGIISAADKPNINKWINGRADGNVVPSLKTLLPIVLCYSYIEDEKDFKSLAMDYPDFLIRVDQLNKYASKARHNGYVEAGVDEIKEISKFIKNTISTLIPDVIIGDAKHSQNDSESSSGYILNNMVSLADIIGWDTLDALNEEAKRLILDLSPSNDQKMSSSEFILNISQFLEAIIFDELKEMEINPTLNKEEIIESIEKRLNGKLPEAFYYVGENYYNIALQKTKSTLNAMTLVYLGFVDDTNFNELNKLDFQDYIAEISSLRAHGNTANLILKKEDIENFRTKLFDILKIIGG